MRAAMLLRVLLLAAAAVSTAQAQTTLFEEIRTIASAVIPVESNAFTVTVAGPHEITLTDLGTLRLPAAPLASVQLAVMRGATVVATLTQPGSSLVTLPAGSYVMRVIGKPGPVAGSGLFSASVRATGSVQTLFDLGGTISASATPIPPTVQVLQTNVTLAAGNYVAEISDLDFPQVLDNASLLVSAQGAAVPAAILDLPGTAPTQTTRSATFTAAGGSHAIFALGDATTAGSGTLAIRILDASSGVPVYQKVIPVGRVTELSGTATLTAGTHTLALADLAFPVPLALFGALVTQGAQPVARSTASGMTTFTVANGGDHKVYTFGQSPSTTASGSLAVEIRRPSAAVAYSNVSAVGGDASTGARVYAFSADVLDAGSYSARVTDLQFSTALSTVNIALVQGATLLGRRDSAGSVSATLAAGQAQLLVYGKPALTTGSLQQTAGLFSAELLPVTGAAVYQATQGVGGLFSSRSFRITSAGDYRFTVADAGFPARFGELSAAVTRGPERLGLIYGEGKFDVLQATPGTYFINFIAKPDATLMAGTYGISAAPKPVDPVVTLTANPVSPAPGATATLTWSTQNATSCQASGSWSGPRAVSGTETTTAITTATTYTLACVGEGGTTTKSLTVTTTAPANSGGGGGGAMDWLLLLLLSVALAARYGLPIRR